ncbi:Bifunctional epoxide hydrolase 2 [Linum perenne]
MDQIKHKFVEVNGSNLHLAEIGAGDKVVVCLHGFPEIWYSWRHQMIALASAGFRVIAPDHRGYGLSDPSLEPEKTKFADLIADLRSILDFLNIPKVAVVAKDFGVLPGYYFALLYPERVLGVVTLGVPFVPPGSIQYHKHLPEGFYFTRWKEPGRAEKSGFRTALQVPYRSFDEEYEMESLEVKVPAMLIAGEKDYVLNFPGMEDYIRSGKVKDFVPELATVFLPEGTHFVQEQLPEQVNQLILKFLDTKIVWS